ncbi:hypothetical protein B7755_043330 [Streptomyces sp. NBS 14/10]|uniref:hypothetical protein n=1 Tax=Streptomyces sp. NBS 14/10 TaxID=1945643 RepID=UPI00117C57A4|nr:hypothetical protein [Streptomyces sp. NBS 14/10]KAK1184345.1 hypothetical protein B7755_043330 [Streptomyces sp. NBS 14/10]
MKWMDNARQRRQDAEELRDKALATVEASTLSHESRPFTQGKVIWGAVRSSMEGAYEALLIEASSLGYDAVLGVGFTSPAQPPGSGSGYSSVNFIAYGTGVTWTSDSSA